MLHYRRGYWSVRNLRSARQFPATASYSWSVKIIRHADYCAFWSSVHVVLHGVTLELLERDGTKMPLALFHFLMLAHPHVLTGFWVPGRQLWLHASCSSTKGFCQATRRDTAFPPGMPLSSIVIHSSIVASRQKAADLPDFDIPGIGDAWPRVNRSSRDWMQNIRVYLSM